MSLQANVSSNQRQLVVFDGEPFNGAGTSGAPVLDADGKVVGMNVGGNDSKGKSYGYANPASAMRKQISAALSK